MVVTIFLKKISGIRDTYLFCFFFLSVDVIKNAIFLSLGNTELQQFSISKRKKNKKKAAHSMKQSLFTPHDALYCLSNGS